LDLDIKNAATKMGYLLEFTAFMREDVGDESLAVSLAVQLLVQARDGLIPIEAIAVAKAEDLG
jgi:hypothetical protein